ncbi:proline-specific peptidase [Coniophora puteana RWD-64-598 SS2]|uniref:Proline-specific peptidase n=1 Tax=Coniophora puteana (strain RWD-64-598) TaxID=741705 RepID=A0A5M3MM02_CONPW|nr:proline-specific peptidase [Coniophora puteana RWD-64-598 SS2]EIW79611.1 proline-specific peptidase [Coniophora puteana RWD-64-598 SS2]
MIAITEGEIAFDVPKSGKACKTWYKVYGDLSDTSRTPTVILHGGPGVPHWYVEPMAEIAERYGLPVVIYDQLGCGLSTHLPEKNGDTDFWTVELFIDELHNLLNFFGIHDNYNVLGHSWGGMLAASFAVRKPKGLKKLILSSAPASMPVMIEICNELRKTLPQDIQDTLDKHEAAGTTDSPEYKAACDEFDARFGCRLQPTPELLVRALKSMEDDPTVYHTMNGPSEFHVIGSLKNWSVIDEIHNIEVPTLLLNGRYDEVQDKAMDPFFLKIKQVRWLQFSNSAHLAQLEETDRYLEVISRFLQTEV